jgi:hypothetical protein
MENIKFQPRKCFCRNIFLITPQLAAYEIDDEISERLNSGALLPGGCMSAERQGFKQASVRAPAAERLELVG